MGKIEKKFFGGISVKKKTIRRIGAIVGATVLGTLSLMAFAGCSTSAHPEVTITYNFNGKDYEVDYVLSRNYAPKTVTRFIELAENGYYDGLVVHDYKEDVALYTGGYKLDENEELEEINFFEAIKQLEEEKKFTLTQSVYFDEAKAEPTYTLYGEFSKNGFDTDDREYSHKKGALVMYYNPIEGENPTESIDYDVWIERADGGKENGGNPLNRSQYSNNCATSLFYTWMGSSNVLNNTKYSVFGMAKDYDGQLTNGLLAAIEEYIEEYGDADDFSFTEASSGMYLNQYDPTPAIANGKILAEYDIPVEPIIIKSVKVTKY